MRVRRKGLSLLLGTTAAAVFAYLLISFWATSDGQIIRTPISHPVRLAFTAAIAVLAFLYIKYVYTLDK